MFYSSDLPMKQVRYHAMTLIEMLIAIGVFAVGVLAVLQLVVNNIKTVDHVSKHMDATMLATQGLELMYELRNTNSYKEVERDCLQIKEQLTDGSETACQTRISDDIGVAVMIAPAGPESNRYRSVTSDTISDNPLDDYRLYRHVSGTTLARVATPNTASHITRFDHDANGGDETPYARYVTFEQVS